jgi:omega-amidase
MYALNISTVQTDLVWESPRENLKAIGLKISDLKGKTDLVVLPEMFTTGFTMSAEQLAEPPKGPTFGWMQSQAVKLQAAITGSIIVKEDGQIFNRLLWVNPDGSSITYDKHHLFSLAGEHQFYSPGESQRLITYKGWKIFPLICYDLRFPVWSRNTSGYDVLLYVANWPSARGHHWRSLLTARAIENQAYTIGVNRVGLDANGHTYDGDSMVIDYSGRILTHMAHSEQVATTSLDWELLHAYRQKFAFLEDRDSFSLNRPKD